MFISRVDDTLSKKFNLQGSYGCRECGNQYGLWHHSSDSIINRTNFVCTKCLVDVLMDTLKAFEGNYSLALEGAAKSKAKLTFLQANPELTNWRYLHFQYKTRNARCHGCNEKAVMHADGRLCCRQHGIILLTTETSLLVDLAKSSYTDLLRVEVFIRELKKMLSDPEYCSELLE